MFYARANVREGTPTHSSVVRELLRRIDELTAAQETRGQSGSLPTEPPPAKVSHLKWVDVTYDDHGGVLGYSVTKCTCDAPWRHKP